MAHYYTDNQDLESKPRTINFDFRGNQISFKSDIGVFSKDSVDYGTRVLLDTIEGIDGMKILDVGCGYGIIGISLKTVFKHISVDMVDVNTRAVHLANENIKFHHLDNLVAFKSNAYEQVTDMYDMILSNPPVRAGKQVVFDILEGAYEHLKVGGILRIVLQKKQGAPSAKTKMEEVFGKCEILKRDKGYYILQSVKE